MRVIVSAPARLHLGFIDLNGACGRVFGSIGVALERPRCVVAAARQAADGGPGGSGVEITETLERLRPALPLKDGVTVRSLESIPRHAGLGSGTQHQLAVGCAVSRLLGRPLPATELGQALGRGRRSGIGIAVFDKGGFVVDAGRPRASGPGAEPPDEPPLVIVQHPVPADWYFVVVVPAGAEGLSGTREQAAFATLPPMDDATVGRISRLTLMKIIPGVLTDDIHGFGEAITEVQTLVGEYFAPVQGGVYATETGARVAALALANGAHGVGQSSWGPAVFALVRGERDARALVRDLDACVGQATGNLVFHTRADNTGATWRTEP